MSRKARQPLPTLPQIVAQRMGKWTTLDQAIQAMRDERRSLCPAHRREWEAARADTRIAISATPAPITLMHIGESDTVRSEKVRRRAFEDWLQLIDTWQQVALTRCRRGVGCTITHPIQDTLPLEAA